MAKRFTDTDKWKDSFFQELPVEYKLLWLYIWDECDYAGVWHEEIKTAQKRLGIKLSLEKARGFLEGRIKIVEWGNRDKWFLPDFISVQYGELTASNKKHKGVIDLLKRHKIDPVTLSPYLTGEVTIYNSSLKNNLYLEGGVGETNAGGPPADDADGSGSAPLTEIADSAPRTPLSAPKQPDPYTGADHAGFKKFNTWIAEITPRVAQMKEPFTMEQFLHVRDYYDPNKVRDMLKSMHNYLPLLKKNISAYVTLSKWLLRNEKN